MCGCGPYSARRQRTRSDEPFLCNALYFYGDGRLPSNGMHGGHFTHRPSRSGGVVCEYGSPPACLDDWTAILPYVTFDPSNAAQRCQGQAVEHGQGMGVARYRRIGGWCVLALWDRTGDVRGNSVAIFYTREGLVPPHCSSAFRSSTRSYGGGSRVRAASALVARPTLTQRR